jgi:glycosyltransferase involved in cell wall biosynthesis
MSELPARARILLVVRWPVGGIRTYLREMLRQKVFDDLDITVLMVRTNESDALIQETTSRAVTWRVVEGSTNSLLRAASGEVLRGSYALVHAHGITAAMCVTVAGFLRRVPMIVTAHEVFTAGQFRGWRGWLKRWAISAALRAFQVIHLVSRDAALNMSEFMPGLTLRAGRLQVVTHGVDVARFSAGSRRDLRHELRLDPDVRLFGFFGRFMAPKGFRVLIRAAELLAERPGVGPFVVACAGSSGFVREDRDVLRNKGLSEKFFFLPFERDIAPTLKGVDAVVMPSLWEASGLLAMEAMVSGTPLVASNCIGLRETVEDTPARVAQFGDAESLAQAMAEEISASSKEAASKFMLEAARRFDARSSFAQVRALYARWLGGKSEDAR